MKLINERLVIENEKSNNESVYTYGFTCQTNNYNPLDIEGGTVKLYSAKVQLDTDGNPIGKPFSASEFDVDASLSELIVYGAVDLDKLIEFRNNKICEQPVEPVVEE